MTVLLIGEHYSSNLGDALISGCFQCVLLEKGIKYKLIDLSGKKEIHDISYNNKCENKIKANIKKTKFIECLINIIQSYRLFSKYVVGDSNEKYIAVYDGGSLFMDFFAPRQFFLNRCFDKNNIDVYYIGCGLGKVKIKINSWFLYKAIHYKNVKDIYLRDSVMKFNEIFHKDAIYTEDIALLSSNYYPRISQMMSKKKVGIGFICLDKDFNNTFCDSVLDLIWELENQKITWEIFTNGAPEDYYLAEKFYNTYKFKYGRLVNKPNNIQNLINTITSYDMILTCRLHSSIIAFSYQIPALTVNWSNKIQEFYKKIGHEELLIEPSFNAKITFSQMLNCSYSKADVEYLIDMQNKIMINLNAVLGIQI